MYNLLVVAVLSFCCSASILHDIPPDVFSFEIADWLSIADFRSLFHSGRKVRDMLIRQTVDAHSMHIHVYALMLAHSDH